MTYEYQYLLKKFKVLNTSSQYLLSARLPPKISINLVRHTAAP